MESFDEHRGLGSLLDDSGISLPFHCTSIADGTRRIEPGTSVCFVVVPGHLGRNEARRIVKLSSG